MLSSFSVGTGLSVTVPGGYTLIVIRNSGIGSRSVVVFSRIVNPSTFTVANGDIYYLINVYGK